MLKSFVTTLPLKISPTTCRASENCDVPVIVKRVFLEFFLPPLIRSPGNMRFKLSLVSHHKCPENNKILEIDLSISETLISTILILQVTLAPLTGLYALKRGGFPSCATKI